MASVAMKKGRRAQDPTAEFFEDLATRGPEPLLQSASGTMRFDLKDGARVEHWYVTTDKGQSRVSHKEAKADAIIRTDKALFDKIATGKANVTAATLRGTLVLEGDIALVMAFQRLFPSPPRPRRRARPDDRKGSAR